MAIEAIDEFRRTYPELDIRFYQRDDTLDFCWTEELKDADIVVIHEWNEPEVVNAILAKKASSVFARCFTILIIAHIPVRARSALPPAPVRRRSRFWRRDHGDLHGRLRHRDVWTFHEAADTTVFQPLPLPEDL